MDQSRQPDLQRSILRLGGDTVWRRYLCQPRPLQHPADESLELVQRHEGLDDQHHHDQHRNQREQRLERQRRRHLRRAVFFQLRRAVATEVVREPRRPLPAVQFLPRLPDDVTDPVQDSLQILTPHRILPAVLTLDSVALNGGEHSHL
jgi:hypothetical protein